MPSLSRCKPHLLVFAAAMLGLAVPAAAAETAAPSCAARIAAVIDDIASRDLDTSKGPPLNAFIALNPSAIAEAGELDRRVAAGERPGPLQCMPVAVKDNFDTFDMPATVGSLSLIGNQAPRDATIVARLRAAGAVIVGKTNMDEFAFGIRGLSGSGGRVGNAYDPSRTSGGSSAGSGVAVGAGFVPLAVGSDNCGSLRIPAVYNGAVALRPTYGRFDSDGLFPIGFVNATPGLIARDVPTLAAGLGVIAGDWRAGEAAAPDALRGKRIGVLVRAGSESLVPDDANVAALLAKAGALLRSEGAEVVEGVALDGFDTRLGPAFVKGSAKRIDARLSRYPAPRRDWRDICRSGRIMPEWTPDACIALTASAPEEEATARDRIAANRHLLLAALAGAHLDALLYLTDVRGAAGTDVSERYTCFLASSTGLPAVALPVGVDNDGMPVGVELLGPPKGDEGLVAMAGALEAARGTLPAAARPPDRAPLRALPIADQNNLRLFLGWNAFKTRAGDDLGALDPERFRKLTEDVVARWTPAGVP